jgi:hypothetical protein
VKQAVITLKRHTVSAERQFPVQNGNANFSLTLTAVFQPPCSHR